MSGLNDLPQLSIEAICRTAEGIGVDPVAFAEACQDGTFLAHAIRHTNHVESALPKSYQWAESQPWLAPSSPTSPWASSAQSPLSLARLPWPGCTGW